MTTYNIGGEEYSYAQWNDEAETDEMFLKKAVGGGGVIVYRLDPWDYWDDIFTSGIYIRPYRPTEFHEWDDVNLVWVLNQTTFTPYLLDQIADYRDLQMSITPNVEVGDVTTYKLEDNEWVIDQTDQTVEMKINERTKLAFLFIDACPPIDNDDPVLRFKFENGKALIRGSTAQACLSKLRKTEQTFFDAEGFVQDSHENTPYTSVQAAKDDFDLYITNNL